MVWDYQMLLKHVSIYIKVVQISILSPVVLLFTMFDAEVLYSGKYQYPGKVSNPGKILDPGIFHFIDFTGFFNKN